MNSVPIVKLGEYVDSDLSRAVMAQQSSCALQIVHQLTTTFEQRVFGVAAIFFVLPVNIFSMVNIKKDCSLVILKIKKGPITSGDPERKYIFK